MSDDHRLPCPACGAESELPLARLAEAPRWKCPCGFEATLPVSQVRDMLNKIELSKRLLRFSAE